MEISDACKICYKFSRLYKFKINVPSELKLKFDEANSVSVIDLINFVHDYCPFKVSVCLVYLSFSYSALCCE